MQIEDYIKAIPKAELHLHIEGSLEPELLFALAQRNKIDLPFDSVEDLRKAYQFSCLQDFLDIYHQGAQVLQKEADFYDLTWAYLTRVHSDNVRHVEIMIDSQTHTSRGVSFNAVINGIHAACKRAEKELDMSHVLILSFLRHLSEVEAFETLALGIEHKDKIQAVGLASSEQGNPPSKFSTVYKKAIAEGFIPVAHAGEEGPPAYIYEALDDLKIVRIDHGNRCLEDPDLVAKIVADDIALTVCPLSNTALCVVDKMENHPLRKMIKSGLKVTINSDDPAYFGGYMNDNFLAVQSALNLTKAEIYALCENGFKYAFCSDELKEKYLSELKEFFQPF